MGMHRDAPTIAAGAVGAVTATVLLQPPQRLPSVIHNTTNTFVPTTTLQHFYVIIEVVCSSNYYTVLPYNNRSSI